MDISMDTASLPCEIPSSDVTVLKGHTSEVCVHRLWLNFPYSDPLIN